jgi:hypothetical protein
MPSSCGFAVASGSPRPSGAAPTLGAVGPIRIALRGLQSREIHACNRFPICEAIAEPHSTQPLAVGIYRRQRGRHRRASRHQSQSALKATYPLRAFQWGCSVSCSGSAVALRHRGRNAQPGLVVRKRSSDADVAAVRILGDRLGQRAAATRFLPDAVPVTAAPAASKAGVLATAIARIA